MADSPATSKRFETPILDSLKPMHRKAVEAYCVLLDKRQAAEAAGYSDNQGQLTAKIEELFSNPTFVAAIDELLASKLEQLDSGRAALCERLLNQSLATLWDVAEHVQYVNRHGKVIEGKFTTQPKLLHDIEPRFRCATAFLVCNQTGTWAWDNMAQHRASLQLSKLMMWDQNVLNPNAPLVFNFGAVQDKPYEAPSDGVDLGAVESKKDEVSELQH